MSAEASPIDPVEGRSEISEGSPVAGNDLELLFTPLDTGSNDEMGFVFKSWLNGHRGSKQCRRMTAESYYAVQHRIIEKVVKAGNVVVCREKNQPEYLIGWIAADVLDADTFALHAAYVRSSCRHEQVFTRMVQHVLHSRACNPALFVHTHRGNRWQENVLVRWGFNFVDGVFR